MNFLFFLGRVSDLAKAETQAVLSAQFGLQAEVVTPAILSASLPDEQTAQNLQRLLGGVVKIAAVSKIVTTNDTKELEQEVALVLKSIADKKRISFGVAEIGRDTFKAINVKNIKDILSAEDISARFIEGTRSGLSASVLSHQNVDEAVVVRAGEQIYLGYTVSVQGIDDWSFRDRGKPARDPKHGMLPPKVARIMLNVALPAGAKGKRILDPFCGTGTIVMESMMIGASESIGSDLRIEAVGQTQKNCEWLAKHLQEESAQAPQFRAVVCDATHIQPQMIGGKVDAIVAEGFLGPLTPRPGALPNIFKGLEKLYKGALKQWRQILNPGARICIALPMADTGKEVFSLAPLIDSLGELGYNTVSGPYIYDRPGAIIKRQIFVLEYRG